MRFYEYTSFDSIDVMNAAYLRAPVSLFSVAADTHHDQS